LDQTAAGASLQPFPLFCSKLSFDTECTGEKIFEKFSNLSAGYGVYLLEGVLPKN
jgi:hypothetical protein